MSVAPRKGLVALSYASICLCSLGVYVAGTLTLAHWIDRAVPCGGADGCAVVATDPSSQFLGVPTSAYGLVAYLVLAGLSLTSLLPRFRNRALKLALFLSGAGCATSIGLTLYASLHLHATCRWCLASLAIMTLLAGAQGLTWERRFEPQTDEFRQFRLGVGFLLLGFTLSSVGIVMMRRFLTSPLDTERIERLAANLPIQELTPVDAHSIGSPRAPLTIVEFADLACPACRAEFPVLMDAVKAHPDRLRLVFRHLPLVGVKGHETSREAAIYAEMCPTDQAFFEDVRRVYSENDPITLSKIRSTFRAIGGHETQSLRTRAVQRVDRDTGLAKRLRLNLTPSFLILGFGSRPRYATSTNLVPVLSMNPN